MKTKSEKPGYISTILLIHAAIFAYQKSLGKMVGSGSGAVLRFAIPYLSEMMDMEGLPDIRKEKSLDENMSIYLGVIKESGYVMDAVFSKIGNNKYTFEMEQCHFASKGHKIFTEGNLTCPFAILAAAVLFMKTEANITLEESKFNENGSLTNITIIQ